MSKSAPNAINSASGIELQQLRVQMETRKLELEN